MQNPILHNYDNYCYCNNGSFIMGFKVILPEIFSLNDTEIDTTINLWQSIIKRLPEGCFIHKLDAYIDGEFDSSVLPDRSYFQSSYKDHFDGREILRHFSYIFFGIKKVSTLSKLLSNPFACNIDKTITEQTWINESFKTAVEAEISYINRSNSFQAIPLSSVEMRSFNFDFFNLFNTTQTTTLRLSDTINIGNEKISVTLGDNLIGGYAIHNEKQLPNELSSIMRDPLVESKQGFNCALGDLFGIYARKPHYLSTVIYRDSKQSWINKLQDTELTYRRYSILSPFYVEKAQEINSVIKDLQGEYNDELIITTNTTLLFWADNIKDYKDTKQYFGDIFKKADILASAPIGKHLKHLFINANPFYSGANSDLNCYPTSIYTPLAFFPLVGNYKNDNQGIFFCDRFNIPFKMDIWDEQKKHIKARNFIMLAPTGEGKSFFLQELLRQMYEANYTLVIIDLGKSFAKFAELLGDDAEFIEYENGKSFSINPFNRPIEELVTSDKLNSLSQYIYAHVDGAPDDNAMIFLRKIIKTYIENNTNLSLINFIHFINENEDEIKATFKEELSFLDFSKFKINLNEFIGNGNYSFLYSENNENKISQSLKNKKVVVFEIDGAKEDAKIINVLLQTIKDTIQTNIWNDKSKKGIILFEEFAKTLKLGNVMTNVEYYYQAIRKQEGAIGIVLQNTSQIPVNSTSESIFENTQIIYALPNKSGYDGMKDRLKLKDNHSLNLLNSLQNNFSGDRKYSEVYIKQGDRERVVRLEVSRQQYLAFITDGEEQRRLNELQKQGHNIYEAINLIQ